MEQNWYFYKRLLIFWLQWFSLSFLQGREKMKKNQITARFWNSSHSLTIITAPSPEKLKLDLFGSLRLQQWPGCTKIKNNYSYWVFETHPAWNVFIHIKHLFTTRSFELKHGRRWKKKKIVKLDWNDFDRTFDSFSFSPNRTSCILGLNKQILSHFSHWRKKYEHLYS